jgi:ABC-type uncharacterized transport system substrate-binding protein
MRQIGLAVVLAINLILAPLAGEAQPGEKVRRIGFLSAALHGSEVDDALRQGLREHGYVEGQNLLIEWRFAEGKYDRLRSFATELVGMKVDVIVTLSTEAALAAKTATASIPIVFTQVSDPIASGVVPSLARPGGNLTGFSLVAVELTGKRLELLKGAVPPLKSVIILGRRASPVNALAVKEAQIAAQRLGMEARLVEVHDAEELEPAFTTMARERTGGIVLVPSFLFVTHRRQVAELAIKSRLPAVSWTDGLSGALITYGPSSFDIHWRAGGYVAKILNGTKPGELPVEQPTKLVLIINLKTAKALGLTIPQSVLLRADQIIE